MLKHCVVIITGKPGVRDSTDPCPTVGIEPTSMTCRLHVPRRYTVYAGLYVPTWTEI